MFKAQLPLASLSTVSTQCGCSLSLWWHQGGPPGNVDHSTNISLNKLTGVESLYIWGEIGPMWVKLKRAMKFGYLFWNPRRCSVKIFSIINPFRYLEQTSGSVTESSSATNQCCPETCSFTWCAASWSTEWGCLIYLQFYGLTVTCLKAEHQQSWT